MKPRLGVRFLLPVFGAFLLASLVAHSEASAQTQAEDLFQQALRVERVSGDLEEAIRLYQRVVETGDRPLGARALIRIAESYEKLGQQGAQDAYNRIIQEFGDQEEQVALARERLAEMDRPAETQGTWPRGITTRQVHKSVFGEAIPLAITPDGRGLVYADLWFGNLAVRDLTNEQNRNLTQDASWAAWAAAVSPDGRTVSYLENTRGIQPTMADPPTHSLRLVGIDGSNSRDLYREVGCAVSHHQWTSGGEHIVAVIQCGEDLSVIRISVPDGGTEPVADLAPGHLQEEGGISLSPDDRYLTYGVAVEADGGNFDIRLLSLDGSLNLPLVRHPANDRLLGWVPGTDEVLFLSDRDGTEDLWAVRITDGAREGLPRIVRRNMGPVDPLGFARDGILVYSAYKRRFSTSVSPFDLETGTVTLESSVGILGSNMPATWSPDSEFLAFVQETRDPGRPLNRTLRIRHLATGLERELAPHLLARNQRWSPDGRFLLLSGALSGEMEDEDRQLGLYLVEVESGQTTQVLEVNAERGLMPFDDLGGEWSKDGRAIIYSLYDRNLEEGRLIWLDLESGEETELFRHPTLTSQQFAVSPEGSRLVFALKNTAQGYNRAIHSGGRLLIMDLDDGDIREFHQVPEGRVWSLQWTPDGKHVMYTKREEHGTAVWRVPVTGGTAERTWTFEEDHFNAWANLSPDGRQVAYTTYHQEFEVWMMENLKEVLLEKAGG